MLDVTRAWGLNFLFPMGDTTVGRSLRESGEFARVEVDLACEIASGTFIDVGANIGAIALPIAARRSDLKVIAVEASRNFANLLAANALSNHLYNAQVHHAAAGATPGIVDVEVPPIDQTANFGGTSLLERRFPTEPVRMLTLDQLAPNDTSFIKVDVEGYEPEVLAGASQLLRSDASWLLEVDIDRREACRSVAATLTAAGLNLFWFFSPFATGKRTKPQFYKRERLEGDYAVFATRRAPPWEMRPFTDAWPTEIADFPYLSRYRAS